MKCRKCLDENAHLIATEGYGYGYIGTEGNCKRHTRPPDTPLPSSSSSSARLKWTDGNPYERSRRMSHQIQMEQDEFRKTMDNSAYTSSLHHDEHTWDILNQSLSGAGFKSSNKREDLGDKLANRDMVQQIGFNPFLGQTNYVDDISIRDQFLKPVNTTQGEKSI